MFSAYLYSLVLAGVFAAVCELVLPARHSSLGRLMKAIVSVLCVFLVALPIVSFLKRDLPVLSLESEEMAQTGNSACEDLVTAHALASLEERIEDTLQERLGMEVQAHVFAKEDIMELFCDIYCDSSTDAQSVCMELSSLYGIECRLVEKTCE